MFDSFQKAIDKFPKEIVEQLKETKQNPKYHKEVTVYNHLWIIYDSILKSDLENTLKKDFLVVAIFHDLGKIDTSKEKIRKDGEKVITSYGHEYLAKDYLDKYLDLFEYNNKEMIYEVCKFHMRAHIFDKMGESKQKQFIANKYYAETMVFADFDDMGKTRSPTFLMLIGVPGAGKSSWVENFECDAEFYFPGSTNNNVIVCPDLIRKEVTGSISDISQDYEVWKVAKERVIKYLSEGKSCILDSTMTISKRRRDFIKDLPICFRYAKVFKCDPLEAINRIRIDMKNNVDRSNVPDSVVFKMHDQLTKDFDKIREDGLELL